MALFDNITFLLNSNLPSYYPFFDKVYKAMNMIYTSNGKTTEKIIEYTKNRKVGERVLAVAPDGGNCSIDPDNKVAELKTGAFVGKFPILPIVIKYDKDNYLNFKHELGETLMDCILKGFLYLNHNVKIKVLDMVYPSDDESIIEYKDRVHALISDEYKNIIF